MKRNGNSEANVFWGRGLSFAPSNRRYSQKLQKREEKPILVYSFFAAEKPKQSIAVSSEKHIRVYLGLNDENEV